MLPDMTLLLKQRPVFSDSYANWILDVLVGEPETRSLEQQVIDASYNAYARFLIAPTRAEKLWARIHPTYEEWLSLNNKCTSNGPR